MASVSVKRPKIRMVEYAKPVRMKGLGGPTSAHVSGPTVSIEYDESFVTVTEEGRGTVMVPMANIVRLELA